MNNDHLITMANQIGAFFQSYPDAEQAKKDIAQHIKRFWAQRMRQQILDHISQHEGIGLDPIVRDALQQNRAEVA